MSRRWCAAFALAVAVGLVGCGNKGPLYLPAPSAEPGSGSQGQSESRGEQERAKQRSSS